MTSSSISWSWKAGMRTMTNDVDMDTVQLACFSIIAHVGEAKSRYMEALRAARAGDFSSVDELIQKGTECFVEGHNAHMELISQEAAEGDVPASLLLMHAEAQLMDGESCKTYVKELIEVYREIWALKA